MSVISQQPAVLRVTAMAALVLAVFVVSIGYGVVLPLLPYLVERLLGIGVLAVEVSRHTGLLTAVYTLSLFLFSPLWGRLADRRGSHDVLLIGLIGFALTSLVFSFVESITAVYAERALSGLFAAAVTPVAAAAVGALTTTERARARRLTFVSMAGISGFLLGPMLGILITCFVEFVETPTLLVGSIAMPLAATGILALLAALAVGFAVPRGRRYEPAQVKTADVVTNPKSLVPTLLTLSFIISTGVGVFEVGLALRGKEQLGLSHYQIAAMFTECSLVMFMMQAIVFSPRFKPEMTRWLIAPALAVLAVALYLVPRASDFALMLAVIGAVASSAGVLSPIVTYWISGWKCAGLGTRQADRSRQFGHHIGVRGGWSSVQSRCTAGCILHSGSDSGRIWTSLKSEASPCPRAAPTARQDSASRGSSDIKPAEIGAIREECPTL